MKHKKAPGSMQDITNCPVSQRVHVAIWYILGPLSRYVGTPLGPKYIPYSYMDPLGV